MRLVSLCAFLALEWYFRDDFLDRGWLVGVYCLFQGVGCLESVMGEHTLSLETIEVGRQYIVTSLCKSAAFWFS